MAANPKISSWAGQRVWVIGASTGIGAETASHLAARGARVALSARDSEKLRAAAGDYRQALILPLDVTQQETIVNAFETIKTTWGGIDVVLIVAGTYTPMRAHNFNLDTASALLKTNLQGTLNVLDVVLPTLLQQRRGALGIVSSVAGYRGLPEALIYGPSKAALINLAETLYLDLRPCGIGVHLICPGFVDTPLTAQNKFKMPALLTSKQAAQQLVRGLEAGQFEITFPKRFTWWLKLFRMLPYALYFPLVRKVTGIEGANT